MIRERAMSAKDAAGVRGRMVRFQKPVLVAYVISAAAGFATAGIDNRTARFGFGIAVAAIGLAAGAFMAVLTRTFVWAVWSVYISDCIVGMVVIRGSHPERAVVWVLGGIAIAAAAAGMVLVVQAVRGSQELERLISFESTSIAFFATMIAAVTYALLESWLDLPSLSAWFVFAFGMGSWILADRIFNRRYS